MSSRFERLPGIATPDSAPVYELRARRHGPGDTELEVWQLPSPASPQRNAPVRIAGLLGRNLDLVEHRVLRRLGPAGLKLSGREAERKEGNRLPEDLALSWASVPHARTDALARQHASGGRGYRYHGARGGRLLARHGHPPQKPASRVDGTSVPADRSTAWLTLSARPASAAGGQTRDLWRPDEAERP